MNGERWQQIKQLLQRAIATDPADRSSFLDHACTNDPDLRREVDSLLASHEQADTGFLNTPAANLTSPEPATARSGHRIGVYQIIEEIGHGGMGEVYRATRADGQYAMEVALKIVRGGYNTAFVLERFRTERQILATLDHPNIARLLDGGTTEDRIPYLVMELIEGTRIDSYCDDHDLSISERLRLFRQVCSAVQYAHQRLVIHRDLKPGNILVTKEAVPKLLDFGIAKILDPTAGVEATITLPMTPEYASPEQIRGEPITTASDVYSLGVVLYQLLTGRSPYPREMYSPHEIARAVCETDPGRPSAAVLKSQPTRTGATELHSSDQTSPEQLSKTREGSPAKLHRRLTGDLDNIALMALRKEPQRRYSSVEQLSEDIRRHLEGIPVAATDGSWSYRATKFVTRHKAGVSASAAMSLVLIAGVGGIVREARIASANERKAENRFNDVRKLANSLMFEIHDSIRDLPGSTPARKLLVSRALEYLDDLSRESKGDVSLRKELAAAYHRVGDVLGYPYAANLGDSAGALASYRKSLAIRESLAAATPNGKDEDRKLQGDLVDTYFRIANVLEFTGDFKGALSTIEKALPITEKLAVGVNDPVQADRLAGCYYFTAGLLGQTGNPAGAADSYRRASSIRLDALKANPGNPFLRTHLAADYAGIAKSLSQSGDIKQAIATQQQAVAILQDVSQTNPNNATLREYLAEATDRLAGFQRDNGDAAEALNSDQLAHHLFQLLMTADSKNFLAKANFALSDDDIARSLLALHRYAPALEALREARTIFEEMSPRNSTDRYARTGLADAYFLSGRTYSLMAAEPKTSAAERQKLWLEARSWLQKSSALWADKQKRAELESDDREAVQSVTEALARCETALLKTAAAKSN